MLGASTLRLGIERIYFCSNIGNAGNGRKAIEVGMVTSRSDDTDIDEVKALLRDPVAHWSYLARKAR
jgi:hypothetical protein